MSATKYTYSISSDFPNSKVCTGRLVYEISGSSIVTAIDSVNTSGDVCDIWMKAALSGGDETTLDGIVAAHSGEPLPNAEAPKTDDDRPYYAPNLFPLGALTDFRGVADDVTNGVERAGSLFTLTTSSAEDVNLEFQFIKYGYIAGGHIQYKGAVLGDYVSYAIHSPATVGTENTGAGAYDKYQVGAGAYMYIPNATTTGDWDLNLTEKLNANVDFTKVAPVPAPAGDGFFDWNEVTEAVTLNALQKGKYNLFDFDVTLGRFVNNVPLLGDDHFPLTVPAVKPVKLLPHWHHKVTLHNSTAKQLDMAWIVYRAAMNSL